MHTRVPTLVTIFLLAVTAGVGWFNQCRINDLREARAQLAAQATESGISIDDLTPDGGRQPPKLPRPDRMEEAREIAAGLIAYGNGSPSPEDRRQRVMTETRRIMSLDGAQLEVLIDAVRSDPELPELRRREFLGFAIRQLAATDPQDALTLLLEIPDLETRPPPRGQPASLFVTAMSAWAAANPSSARTWLQEHRDDIPASLRPLVEHALLREAAGSAPRLALELHQELGRKQHEVSSIIKDSNLDPGERLAFLDALRAWSRERPEGTWDQEAHARCLCVLAYEKEGFEATSRWLDQADFSPTELEHLCARKFDSCINPGDTRQWFEWLGTHWPGKTARKCRLDLLRGSSTAIPAAKCLIEQPDSPQRHELVWACVNWTFMRDPELGILLARSLPTGARRSELLQRFHAPDPGDQPEQ